jgi:hypothetical protein
LGDTSEANFNRHIQIASGEGTSNSTHLSPISSTLTLCLCELRAGLAYNPYKGTYAMVGLLKQNKHDNEANTIVGVWCFA